jgi:protein kinase X
MKILQKEQVVRLRQVEHINSEREILASIDNPFLVHMLVFNYSKNLSLLTVKY